MVTDCPFCSRAGCDSVLAENELAVAFLDAYPLSPGHSLVVPRRHEPDFFALSNAEQQAAWALVAQVRMVIRRKHGPDGFNIGINAGAAAGQTIPHAHIHLIPRYGGDVQDPRGGIRWIIPAKAAYWRE